MLTTNKILFQESRLDNPSDLEKFSSKIFFCSFLLNTYNGLSRNLLLLKCLSQNGDSEKTIREEIFEANRSIEKDGLIIADEMRKQCMEQITYCISCDNESIVKAQPCFAILSQQEKTKLFVTLDQQRKIAKRLCDSSDTLSITIFVSVLTKADSCVLISDNILSEDEKLAIRLMFLKSIFEIHKSDFSKKSVQSAIGSIMSRNGSHNIGSHVLSALTHHIGTMPDDRVLYQYIQQRMDFIATVTTEFPSWTTSTMFVGNLMKTFLSQHHLLDYISESEGLHAYHFQEPSLNGKKQRAQNGKIRIHIRRVERDKEDHRIANDVTHFISYGGDHSILNSNSVWEKDVALAIPGGVVGQHAFFTILENIIRNAAKHGWGAYSNDPKKGTAWRCGSKPRNLDIHISFEESDEDDSVVFTIWDNVSDILYSHLEKPDNTIEKYHSLLAALSGIDEKDSACVGYSRFERSVWIKKTFDRLFPSGRVFHEFRRFTDVEENKAVLTQVLQPELTSSEINAIRKLYHYSGDILAWWPDAVARNDGVFLEKYIYEVFYALKDVPGNESVLITAISQNRVDWIKKNIGVFSSAEADADDSPDRETAATDRSRSILKHIDSEELIKVPLTKTEILSLKQIDYKKYAPLHMQQQILLSQSFIGEQGDLKRENWGMSEMKISAGFLWHYGIEEIGSLKELDHPDDYIIRPVCVDACYSCPNNKDGKKAYCDDCLEKKDENGLECLIRRKKLYHLGYRFKVHKPREVLIVFDELGKDPEAVIRNNAGEFREHGVYFALLRSGDKKLYRFPIEYDSNGLERSYSTFNFDYVVFPAIETARNLISTKRQDPAKDETIANEVPPANEEGVQQKGTAVYDQDILSYLPFRVLFGSTGTNDAEAKIKYSEINQNICKPDIPPEEIAIGLKSYVYKSWLAHLKARHNPGWNNNLTMQLQTEGSSGSSQGLFTNYDLLEYVFQNLYHSVLKNAVSGDSDVGMIMRMIALCPDAHEELPQRNLLSDDIYTEIKETISRICSKIRKAYPYLHRMASSDNPSETLNKLFDVESDHPWRGVSEEEDEKKKQKAFIETYHELLMEDGGLQLFIRMNSTEAFEQKLSEFTAIDDFSEDEMMAMLDEVQKDSPFSALVDPPGSSVLAKELYTAYQNCEVMLRKREDHIATLPPIYSMAGSSSETIKPNSKLLKEAGIEIDSKKPLIKYCRHDKNRKDGMIYAEGLSGSQSYLGQLHRISHDFRKDDVGMFVRLAENALMRVLIIDERVSKFLHEHKQMNDVYKAMNIDVADISDKKNGIASAMTLPLEDLDLHDKESSGKWDILIIHQGIIDKWFSNHDDKKVKELISNLQSQVPYTVITTGRGRPDNVPDEAKILPFSTIESTLFCEYPEKLLLVGTVMNILPPGK